LSIKTLAFKETGIHCGPDPKKSGGDKFLAIRTGDFLSAIFQETGKRGVSVLFIYLYYGLALIYKNHAAQSPRSMLRLIHDLSFSGMNRLPRRSSSERRLVLPAL
jgi:hypothetical protein